jgi:hypothetical protein
MKNTFAINPFRGSEPYFFLSCSILREGSYC